MQNRSETHKILQKLFGSNYWYVAELFDSYSENENSVSEYWQNYFKNLIAINGDQIQKDNQTENETAVKSKKETSQKDVSKKESGSKGKSEKENLIKKDSVENVQLITGVGAKIIENMMDSLSIPTATSERAISAKLLEENRRIINKHLAKTTQQKVSFTHIVAFAIVKGLKDFPSLNNSYAEIDSKPHLIVKNQVNFGIAVDIERKDGSRSLIVPNIKKADKMSFAEFFDAYEDIISRSRKGKIEPDDFQGTTISLTNPGNLGTVFSIPRLMTGQGTIIAVGAIEYPAEFQAMDKNTISSLGVGKVMNVTNTYDHRIIQGAESGLFLKKLDELLLGGEDFYKNIFDDMNIPYHPVDWTADTKGKFSEKITLSDNIEKHARILQLINIYRVRGHLIANLNPLGSNCGYHAELDPANYGFTIWDYDRNFITGGLGNKDVATLREILDTLQQTYCDKIGVEYMHIQHPEEKAWLQKMMEPVMNIPKFDAESKKRILWKLSTAEGFEKFLHTKFIGSKRFSLEGSETLIPVLDHLINLASENQVEEIFIGMAHRGRLNVLANIIGKKYEKIFSEFEGNIDPYSFQGSGDVKYHLGATGTYQTRNNKSVTISLASNPSHLEWVNPVVEGIVRAKQQRKNDIERDLVVPILIHGDAAFAGQGVVAETLNLSQLKGYRTGGTVHIIVNNQIGFTTNPDEARSSIYATDVAKMVQAPIFHVNGDDPEAALWVAEIAIAYRQQFNKDIVIDLFGYRRHGHNEGDDPAYTQPLMYKKINSRSSVKEIYFRQLLKEKLINEDEFKEMENGVYECLNDGYLESQDKKIEFNPSIPLAVSHEEIQRSKENLKNDKITEDDIQKIVEGITKLPDGFEINPKLKKSMDKRREIINDFNQRIDWAFAEALSIGSILLKGNPVRLSGQDSARGTFSQRHFIFTDINSGDEYLPLNFISQDQAKIEALDSLLSEAAVLGFEYGYSVVDPLTLILWEAQFGDFANSAQVIIDNFLVSSYQKWKLASNLVMLLPHGYEGQGPEHSSARIERFLILSAENNMYVCNPTTPAQYFHLLRRQIRNEELRPLIVFTPKSLLRLPEAKSAVKELLNGKFREVIDDEIVNKDKAKRVIFVSGKLYYDMLKFRETNKIENAALVRLEQYYPYESDMVKEVISKYKNASKIVWAQEEPLNMGAWSFLQSRLIKDISKGQTLIHVGRNDSASPATGSNKTHNTEQEKLIKEAFEK